MKSYSDRFASPKSRLVIFAVVLVVMVAIVVWRTTVMLGDVAKLPHH